MKELFYKPIKVRGNPDNILFWGCPHIHHDPKWENPLWEMRGFESVEEHDETLIDHWNFRANDSTIGFILGDIMFGKGGQRAFEDILDKLNFSELYICSGNHTAGFRQSFESIEGNILYLGNKKVIFCPNYFEAFINGQSVVMSHYPILSFNGMGGGSWALFSHVHGTLEKSEIGRLYKNSGLKCYEVSVEENPFPVTFAELQRFMVDKNGESVDHHGKNTQNPF